MATLTNNKGYEVHLKNQHLLFKEGDKVLEFIKNNKDCVIIDKDTDEEFTPEDFEFYYNLMLFHLIF